VEPEQLYQTLEELIWEAERGKNDPESGAQDRKGE
jgi:hypothetical protein